MNRFIFVCFFAISNFFFAQKNSGVISYKVVINGKNISKTDTIKSEEKKEIVSFFKNVLKNSIEKNFELHFNDTTSLFIEKSELGYGYNSDLYGKSGDDKLFINIKKKLYINQIDLFGKLFLISDSINKINWKIDKSKEKIILNRKTYKASYFNKINNKEHEIVAWFSEDIPVSFGPEFYCGLPGIILELDTGSLLYKCENIVFEKQNIKKPNSGKKVTQKEFDVISNQKQIEILGF